MKKIINILITLSLLLSCMIIPARAGNDISVTLNGEKIYFDQPPIIQNGRTLVPMRAIFEAMGCRVEWDDGVIDVWDNDENIMTLWVDDPEMWVAGGDIIVLDVPPQIINDRTLVPVRAISESMGAVVNWLQNSSTVEIVYTDDSCKHSVIREVTEDISYQNTGSSTTHKTSIDYIEQCADCLETFQDMTRTETTTEEHSFVNGICNKCGYSKSKPSDDDDEIVCEHKNTHKTCLIDFRSFENTGSETSHNVIDILDITCDDCGEKIQNHVKDIYEKKHSFEDGVCTACGYVKSSSNISNSHTTDVTSSGEVTEWSDGTFMYITVPNGASIKVPNTSAGTLQLALEGTCNLLEYKKDGKMEASSYKADKSGYKISKGSSIIIESMENNLTVKIPLEYAEYQKTSEKVYNVVTLNEGESVKLTPSNDQNVNIYFSDRNFEYIEYNDESVSSSGVKNSSKQRSLSRNRELIVTASENMEVYYCPATTNCTNSNSAFLNVSVGAGEKIRIYASDNSPAYLYTDEKHDYVYATYGTDGTVKTSYTTSKPTKKEKVSISKKCYMDLTNVSNETMIIKVSNMYSKVEQ